MSTRFHDFLPPPFIQPPPGVMPDLPIFMTSKMAFGTAGRMWANFADGDASCSNRSDRPHAPTCLYARCGRKGKKIACFVAESVRKTPLLLIGSFPLRIKTPADRK